MTTRRRYVSVSVLAAILMIGSATVRASTASAGGYITSSGLDGEVVCQPGGDDDCGNAI